MPSELKDLTVVEVSLVDFPANRRMFLVTKNKGESTVEELLALILETDLENGEEVKASLEGVSDSAQAALLGALKLFNAHREEVDVEVFKSMLTKAGILDENKDDADDDDDAAPLLKADGSLNLDDVPEHLRADIEKLWKERADTEKRADELQEEIAKAQEEAAVKTFIQKAESFTLPVKADELGPVLRAISEKCPDEYSFVEDLLTKASTLISTSELLEEKGGKGADTTQDGDSWEKAKKLAEELVKNSDGKITLEKAIDLVFKANPELSQAYVKEN
jgi:hypothetical protein